MDCPQHLQFSKKDFTYKFGSLVNLITMSNSNDLEGGNTGSDMASVSDSEDGDHRSQVLDLRVLFKAKKALDRIEEEAGRSKPQD